MMWNDRKIRTAVTAAGLLALSVLWGCGAQEVASRWNAAAISVDGRDHDWPGTPQVDDPKHDLAVRISNDATTVYLCLAVADNPSAASGLTVWIDPAGGTAQVFGIHLEGSPRRRPRGMAGSGGPGPGPVGGDPAPGDVPAGVFLETVAITYADTTGPLSMTMDELRRTGIDIGVGRDTTGRRVYEFSISRAAAPCLAVLRPGTLVGVAFSGGGRSRPAADHRTSSGPMDTGRPGNGNGGPPPGGMRGSGGGPMGGAPPDDRSGNAERAKLRWLKVRLADDTLTRPLAAVPCESIRS